MIFENDYDKTIQCFNKSNVDYMIVGGYAVNFHGYSRSTTDLDIWVNPIENNKQKIYDALILLEYKKKEAELILKFDFSKPFLFRIAGIPDDIEVFNFISGVDYKTANENKILFSLPNQTPTYFISIKDLIVNKMLSGRAIDKLDVEELQKINMHSKDKSILATLKKLFGNL